jgi:hypothetical protein
MSEIQNAIIVETLVEALATMAFVPLMPIEGETPVPTDPRHVKIDFTAPNPGSIELVAPIGLGLLLAANILGTDTSDPEAAARGDDALRELVNVTCGTLLRHFATHGQMPRMGLPASAPFDAEQWESYIAQPDVHVLDADGHVIAIRLLGLE